MYFNDIIKRRMRTEACDDAVIYALFSFSPTAASSAHVFASYLCFFIVKAGLLSYLIATFIETNLSALPWRIQPWKIQKLSY